MITQKTVKGSYLSPKYVGVVTSLSEFAIAIKLPKPPSFFELRLDYLWKDLDEVERRLPRLLPRGSTIITARHPREGGVNDLSVQQRRQLLVRFLPYATFIDIELNSVRSMAEVRRLSRRRGVRLILSFHDFYSTPAVRSLCAKARAAKKEGAHIFKVATRANAKADVTRLVEFFSICHDDIPISAMGVGRFGVESRKQLARHGSALIYGSIGRVRVPGQPSIAQMQRWTLASAGVER
jgi:3-dehydroquinate dehydratase-1